MRKKSLFWVKAIVGIATLFMAAGLYAGTKVQDVTKMEDPSYKHKKSIMKFTHKKHAEEYAEKFPEYYKNGCGECHHDKNGKPLALKMGDDVQRCIECHKKPGERPKGKGAPKLTKEQRLEYHAEAIHYNCKGCHTKYNKKYKPETKAPTTCAKCHPKKKK